MNRHFGTDGIRGIANRDLLPEFALKLGRALANALRERGEQDVVLIGRDTRCSGAMLEAAFVAGLLSTGRSAITVGIVPTPAVAMLTRRLGASAGVMISASHNPIEDNGFKFFDRNGFKLPDAIEEAIEEELANDRAARPTHAEIGSVQEDRSLAQKYVGSLLERDVSLEGLVLVVDAGFGAAYEIAPQTLAALGAQVVPLHAEPDGSRINVACGATDLVALSAAVRASAERGEEAIGVAFDGDADRVRFVDERGAVVDGDAIFLALARLITNQLKPSQHTVVGTVMTNFACEVALGQHGITLLRAPVGDRYVLEQMRASGAIFGGEPSGHLIDLRTNTTGDGLSAAITLLSHIVRRELRLHELVEGYSPYPQILANIRLPQRRDTFEHPIISSAVRNAQERLGNRGRVLIRPSGTEPLMRVMVEGEDPSVVTEISNMLVESVNKALHSSDQSLNSMIPSSLIS